MIDLSTLTCLPGLIDVHAHLDTNTSGYADVDVKRASDGGVIPGRRMQWPRAP